MKKQQHDSSSSTSDTAEAATHLQKRLRSLPTFARELIAGGLAGGLAKTAVAPLERTKIIFQTRGGQLTVQGVLQYIWQQEGFVGLFKGNTASVLRIVPYAAIHFGLYEYYRRGIVQLAIPHSRPGSKEQGIPLWDLLAGSASGVSAVLATYPLDLVRTRLAYATEAPASTQPGAARMRHRHPGIFALLTTTAKDEGLLGLYRGVLPTLLGILPYAGLKFYVYQTMKNHYRAGSFGSSSSSSDQAASQMAQQQQQQQSAPAAVDSGSIGSSNLAVAQAANCSLALTAANSLLSNGGNQQQHAGQQQQPPDDIQLQQQQQQQPPQKLPVLATLVFGGLAGLVAQTVTYPLDVIRRQLQVAHLNRSASIKELKLQLSNSSSTTSGTNPHTAAAAAAAAADAAGSSSSTSTGLRSAQMPLHSAAANSSSSSNSWQRSSAALAAAPGAAVPQPAAGGSGSSGSSSSSDWSGANPSRPATSGGCRQLSRTAQRSTMYGSMHSMHSAHSVLHPEPSMVAITRNLVAQGGVRVLFRGLSINYMKVVPSTAIGFTVYDALKSYLDLTSSL